MKRSFKYMITQVQGQKMWKETIVVYVHVTQQRFVCILYCAHIQYNAVGDISDSISFKSALVSCSTGPDLTWKGKTGLFNQHPCTQNLSILIICFCKRWCHLKGTICSPVIENLDIWKTKTTDDQEQHLCRNYLFGGLTKTDDQKQHLWRKPLLLENWITEASVRNYTLYYGLLNSDGNKHLSRKSVQLHCNL